MADGWSYWKLGERITVKLVMADYFLFERSFDRAVWKEANHE